MPTPMPTTKKPISAMSYQEIRHEIVEANYQVEAAITHSDHAHQRRWEARLERLLVQRRKIEDGED
jgi:hypothetical protein